LSLIKTISDQVHIGFTGRVNVLTKDTGKYLGRITIKDGIIVFSQYKDRFGKQSLYHCLIDDLENEELKFAVEPEIVTDGEVFFYLEYKSFVDIGQKIFQAYRSSRKFRPPGHIRLIINPAFVAAGQEIGDIEFDLLTTISEFSRVSDIFNESNLLEYQISNGLVSLRQKGALKVIA
jgi:hypothetical protein